MKELITRPQADTLFTALLVIGIIAGPVAWAVARHRGGDRLLWALAVGAPPVLVGLLWRVYNAITDRLGLDTVRNLAVNFVLFVVVGGLCGLAWGMLASRRGQPASDEAAAKNGNEA